MREHPRTQKTACNTPTVNWLVVLSTCIHAAAHGVVVRGPLLTRDAEQLGSGVARAAQGGEPLATPASRNRQTQSRSHDGEGATRMSHPAVLLITPNKSAL